MRWTGAVLFVRLLLSCSWPANTFIWPEKLAGSASTVAMLVVVLTMLVMLENAPVKLMVPD